jgi:hypothetical protein
MSTTEGEEEMASERIENLVGRLEKGNLKTWEVFEALTPEQWTKVVYETPYRWDFRALLAHFLSAEESLLELAKHNATGGEGLPVDFDYDKFNAEEQIRLQGKSPEELMRALQEAREATLDWVRSLDERQLDIVGKHPVLGEVNLETMITAIYGHQLLHMKEARGKVG